MFDPETFLVSSSVRRPLRERRPLPSFHSVTWSEGTPTASPRARGAKRIGLAYEARVLDVLSSIYGDAFRRSPPIQYRTSRGGDYHLAIPDGVLELPGWTVIVEVKLAHTEVVWEQVMERYLPLLRQLTDAPLRPVEVCRSYDPAIPLPGPHTVIESLHRPPERSEQLEVLQWRI